MERPELSASPYAKVSSMVRLGTTLVRPLAGGPLWNAHYTEAPNNTGSTASLQAVQEGPSRPRPSIDFMQATQEAHDVQRPARAVTSHFHAATANTSTPPAMMMRQPPAHGAPTRQIAAPARRPLAGVGVGVGVGVGIGVKRRLWDPPSIAEPEEPEVPLLPSLDSVWASGPQHRHVDVLDVHAHPAPPAAITAPSPTMDAPPPPGRRDPKERWMQERHRRNLQEASEAPPPRAGRVRAVAAIDALQRPPRLHAKGISDPLLGGGPPLWLDDVDDISTLSLVPDLEYDL